MKIDESINNLKTFRQSFDTLSQEVPAEVNKIGAFLGATDMTEFEPMTEEEIINELNTMWEEI